MNSASLRALWDALMALLLPFLGCPFCSLHWAAPFAPFSGCPGFILTGLMAWCPRYRTPASPLDGETRGIVLVFRSPFCSEVPGQTRDQAGRLRGRHTMFVRKRKKRLVINASERSCIAHRMMALFERQAVPRPNGRTSNLRPLVASRIDNPHTQHIWMHIIGLKASYSAPTTYRPYPYFCNRGNFAAAAAKGHIVIAWTM